MQRRHILTGLAAAGAGLGLSACSPRGDTEDDSGPRRQERFRWRMYTTWPRNFPGLGTGANRLAEAIGTLSGGRLQVQVYGAGERVPAMEVFDAVARGSAQMGHGAAYYWKGKHEAASFFTAMPFGMNAQESNAWLHYGDGMALWRRLYEDFNLVPFEAGNTGAQMAGWFRRPLEKLSDLRGLRVRIPGLGGDVMARAGATTVNIPGGELYQALSSGVIDAAEWVGPYNDLAFGFHNAAKHYHYPGWQEPSGAVEMIVNREAWQSLPEDLQQVVEQACAAASHSMLAEMTARNGQALKELQERHGVEVLPLPDEVMDALRDASQAVLTDITRRNAFAREVWENYRAFQTRVGAWTRIGDAAQHAARAPVS